MRATERHLFIINHLFALKLGHPREFNQLALWTQICVTPLRLSEEKAKGKKMIAFYKIILFIVATIGVIWISRASLRDAQSHGFYRFFAWETILILFLMNMDYWFLAPFSLRQIFSWTFLILSLELIYQGVQLFRRKGKSDHERNDSTLIAVEKTTALVSTGIYEYIRHPFYSSLLFLAWGISLKNINWIGIVLAIVTTLFLIVTAKKEETENIKFFGEKYQEYMHTTKMFIPFVI